MIKMNLNKCKKSLSLNTRLLVVIGAIFVAAGVFTILFVNWSMKRHALMEARDKARIILDHNLSIHTYFTHQLKPRLFETIDVKERPGYFDPIWMSSTYAIREIEKYFEELATDRYYYKECAVNARHPDNEADEYEKSFIEELNRDPSLEERTAIRTLVDQDFFTVLRKGEVMEESCLRCHSTPEQAPEGLVEAYGPDRSFDRSVDQVVSAISIRIPLEEAYASANRFSLQLAGFLGLVLAGLFGAVVFLNNRWVLGPLDKIRTKARLISSDPAHLGEEIDPPPGRELSELAAAFNQMSRGLQEDRGRLEARVAERTEELEAANQRLRTEISERKRTIDELQETLREIKLLRGILPICSYCKKVRDDQGYWNQLERYITEHSAAELSHCICPKCAEEHFPGMDLYDE